MAEDQASKPGRGWRFFGAMFGRDKGTNGTPERVVSHHKVWGSVFVLVALGLLLFGGTWLTDDQAVEIAKAGGQIPSRWGSVPWELWATIGAFLGVDVATKALGRR